MFRSKFAVVITLLCGLACSDMAFAQETRSFSGLTSSEYQRVFNSWTERGYWPVALTGYERGGRAAYDVVFEQSRGNTFVARHGLRTAEFNSTNERLRSDGFRLKLHTSFRVGGEMYHAAVWVKR
jgi:hypothetical protein